MKIMCWGGDNFMTMGMRGPVLCRETKEEEEKPMTEYVNNLRLSLGFWSCR